jgi:hypothetical protein
MNENEGVEKVEVTQILNSDGEIVVDFTKDEPIKDVMDSDIVIMDSEGNAMGREEIEKVADALVEGISEETEEVEGVESKLVSKKHNPIFTKKYISDAKKRIKKKMAKASKIKNRNKKR